MRKQHNDTQPKDTASQNRQHRTKYSTLNRLE